MTLDEIYAILSTRMPAHGGAISASNTEDVSALSLVDKSWVDAQITLSAKHYRRTPRKVLGVLWWYSVSSVLVAPALESFVLTGTALNPALDSTTLYLHQDGRFIGARASSVLGADSTQLGAALGKTLTPIMETVAAVTDASLPALRAITTDSIANRILWATTAAQVPETAATLAKSVITAMHAELPQPRYVHIGSNLVVHRASCCLIYQATGGELCLSCPRQTPAEREKRLRQALG